MISAGDGLMSPMNTTPPPRPEDHPQYTPDDLAYLRGKGYDDAEVLAIWDRDARQGHGPLHHGPIPDVMPYLPDAGRPPRRR